ncbi:MAG: ATP-binding protein [Elusimicrobia bacterium]|nr:ATP-binding protein [Elusimicrobiota bacterium]
MSESAYIEQQIARFRQRHPAADGWRLHRVEPYCYQVYTPLLPAFLRKRAPDALLREEVTTTAGWSDGKECRRWSLTELPCRRRGAGFDETNWIGEVDLTWQGQPIHYLRQPVVQGDREQRLVLIATKSRPALEDLWDKLRAFERAENPRGRNIMVFGDAPIRRPRVSWDDVVLPGSMLEDIRMNTESFLGAKRSYRELKLAFRRGFLFAGPPGCGKTMMAKIILAQARASAFILPLTADTSDITISLCFQQAASEAPAVVLLEDLDRIVQSPKISMSYLLNLLDGLDSPDGLLVLGTTNAPEKLDQALLHRPSRFDQVWHFGLPGLDERYRLLTKRAIGRFSDAALRLAAQATSGFTMAYVQETVVNAFMRAIKEHRPPRDVDLADSVERLKAQHRSNLKADGAVQRTHEVGFSAPNGAEVRHE